MEPHELETINYFLHLGYDIEVIVPRYTPGSKNADFFMNGLVWESKCPMGKSLSTVEHLFRKAVRQSENVIFDLRNFGSSEVKAVKLLLRIFNVSKKAKRIKIIKRNNEMVECP